MPTLGADRGLSGVIEILRNGSIGLTNLEEVLLDEKDVPPAEVANTFRWPFGTKRQAGDLKTLGITAVSLANDHIVDYGVAGMTQTESILNREGLRYAGCGKDYDQARVAMLLGVAPRRVAVIAITTSAAAQSRATPTRDEIIGRAGVYALRYSPEVTVDPATFAILKRSRMARSSERGAHDFTMEGTLIREGLKTAVEFKPSKEDVDSILHQITWARSNGDVVVVMLHSHEPTDQSQVPAEFVQSFCRSLIDAGANLVIGSGPHQLRGIEVHNGGAILYSLGNLAFDYNSVDPRAQNVYDSGIDLLQLALGVVAPPNSFHPLAVTEPQWWESIIAVATFDQVGMTTIRLQPIDLGVDLPLAQRGVPRVPTAARADIILRRLTSLSQTFGTTIRREGESGYIDLRTDSHRERLNSPK